MFSAMWGIPPNVGQAENVWKAAAVLQAGQQSIMETV
jgi:hypothetical protein